MEAQDVRPDEPTVTILLIDDDPQVRTALRPLLEKSGYQVLEAEDAEAGKRLADQHGSIQLLIMDVKLPVGTGLELAWGLRERFPDLRVIYTSIHTWDDLVAEPRILKEPFGFIRKPFAPEVLARWVHAVFGDDVSRRPRANET